MSLDQCCKCGADVKIGWAAIWQNGSWQDGSWLWVKDASTSYQWDSTSNDWVAASSSWNGSAGSQETLRTYCHGCWKSWGRHVKPGCKYGLSKLCEQLAVRLQVEFFDDWTNKHKGNPFKCTLCGSRCNHRTLEGHLKRHEKSAVPPIIYVPFSSDSEMSDILQGTYAMTEWKNGKPVYQRMRQEGSDPPDMVIYYDTGSGSWYFAHNCLCDEVFAFNHGSSSGLDGSTPPLSGWTRFEQGNWVSDGTLKIIIASSPSQRLSTGQHGTTVEAVWEFLASKEGCPEDWQPMGAEMQAELEKQWADGWQGENGSGTFHVKTKNGAYGIDCATMAQWNMSTQRRRPIRREHKLTAAVVPKLLEKQRSLQREVDTHAAEKAEWEAKLAELQKECEILKSCRAEFGAQMALQEPWRMGRQLNLNVRVEVPQGDPLFAWLETAIRQACPNDHWGDCNPTRQITVTRMLGRTWDVVPFMELA